MIPNLVISFATADLNTGELSTTRIYSKVKHPLTVSLVQDIDRMLSRYLNSDIYLAFEDSTIHIELDTDNMFFFGHRNIFCSKLGNVHPQRMQCIINSLKNILL